MGSSSRRHGVLASDVVRSWIGIGVGLLVPFAATLGFIVLAPEGVREFGVSSAIRLNYYAFWTLFCVTYISLSFAAFTRLDHDSLHASVSATDPGPSRARRAWWALNGGGAIWWALTGTAFTLYTVVDLIASGEALNALLVGSSVVVVIATVSLMIVAFAVHYARENAVHGGLAFPGGEAVRFSDYVYLSVQITTTFGGSDVQLQRSRMRRQVSMHSLMAFTINAVVVALLISVLVGRA